jgi:hypothetical protein
MQIETVKVDQGGANARILAKESKADFRRIETPSLKVAVTLHSAEGKRVFLRLFNTLQVNMHLVSVVARARLPPADIDRIETAVRGRLAKAAANLDEVIEEAERQCQQHGITTLATYDTVPLALDVKVLSSISRRFLELICRFDQIMPLLRTLEIFEVISLYELDSRCADLKHRLRDVARGARGSANNVRKKMKELESRRAAEMASPGGSRSSAPSGTEDELDDEAALTVDTTDGGATAAADLAAGPTESGPSDDVAIQSVPGEPPAHANRPADAA